MKYSSTAFVKFQLIPHSAGLAMIDL